MSTVADLTGHLLGTLVATEQASARMPSLVAGVVRDGELVWQGSAGPHTGGPPPGPAAVMMSGANVGRRKRR